MNVASLSNSKRLYELSGWDDLLSDGKTYSDMPRWGISQVPQYNSGYLLRKLSAIDDPDLSEHKANIYVTITVLKNYSHAYVERGISEVGLGQRRQRKLPEADADTPEDCLALLAIKLIEEKVIGK